jgi:hypothetical protein
MVLTQPPAPPTSRHQMPPPPLIPPPPVPLPPMPPLLPPMPPMPPMPGGSSTSISPAASSASADVIVDGQTHPPHSPTTLTQETPRELRECPICYDALGGPLNVSALPCFHVFHTKCIAEWCERAEGLHDTCPMCREAVPMAVSSSFHAAFAI